MWKQQSTWHKLVYVRGSQTRNHSLSLCSRSTWPPLLYASQNWCMRPERTNSAEYNKSLSVFSTPGSFVSRHGVCGVVLLCAAPVGSAPQVWGIAFPRRHSHMEAQLRLGLQGILSAIHYGPSQIFFFSRPYKLVSAWATDFSDSEGFWYRDQKVWLYGRPKYHNYPYCSVSVSSLQKDRNSEFTSRVFKESIADPFVEVSLWATVWVSLWKRERSLKAFDQ